MSRKEFIEKLEKLLAGIPKEERDEALQYYADYFEDAGEENEAKVITELGSPENVADMIKVDLKEDGGGKGEFTENGYRDSGFTQSNSPMPRPNRYRRAEGGYTYRSTESTDAHKHNTYNSNGYNSNGYNSDGYNSDGYNSDGYNGNGYNSNGYNSDGYSSNGYSSNGYSSNGYNGNAYDSNKDYDRSSEEDKEAPRTSKALKIVLIILIALVVIPTVFPFMIGIPFTWPLLLGIPALIIGLVLAIFVFFLGLVIACAVLMTVGGFLVVVGISTIYIALPAALLVTGLGLVIFITGLAATVAAVKLCILVYPAIFRGIVNICRLPFHRKAVS